MRRVSHFCVAIKVSVPALIRWGADYAAELRKYLLLSRDYVGDVWTVGNLKWCLEGEHKLYVAGTWSCGWSSDVDIGQIYGLEATKPCFVEEPLTCDVALRHDLKYSDIFWSGPNKVHVVYVRNVNKLGNWWIASGYGAEIFNSYDRNIAIHPLIYDTVKFLCGFPIITCQLWCLPILWRQDGLLREFNEDSICWWEFEIESPWDIERCRRPSTQISWLNDFEIIYFSELKVRLDCYLLSQNSIASFTDNVQGNRIVDIHHEVRVFEACEFKAEFLVGGTNTIQAKRSSRHKIVIGCIFGNYCALNTDGLE